MNGEEFFNAINMIDDDLIEEAQVVRKAKRKNKTVFWALAACLAVFVSAAVILSGFGVLPSYETAEDAVQNTGTTDEVSENVLVGATGNKAPESIEPEGATGIYIPETQAPEVSATLQPETVYSGEYSESKENEAQTYEDISEGYSTPPQEAVTQEDKNSSPVVEATTGKAQDYNGNSGVKSESFKAKIIEINGNSVMVEPLDAPESSSSDKIVFSKARLAELDVKKGDVVIIVYDGLIMESYPAQIIASSWSFAE